MHHESLTYRFFRWSNNIFLILLAILCILPILHILAISFSEGWAVSSGKVTFWPMGFNLANYNKVFGDPLFMGSILTSFERVVLGVGISMTLMTIAAYALSKDPRKFKGRTIWIWLFVFTMLFNGGLIPTYIVVQKVGILNSMWALVLPQAVNVYSMILLLNFFRSSVPQALEEAAYIDGAGQFRTLWSIYLPVSMPAIATISLFTMVFYWNEWFYGLLFMSSPQNYPLASLMQTMFIQHTADEMVDPELLKLLSDRAFRAAQIFISMIPVMLVYPFLQKYFVKGIVIGSVKE
ncbi:carbohydrate ABC transporter permease [Paenibacillus sp. LHD-38]|uniref:carbohydrate ABC transporter permease n=1 Tax=Paenibacillus sp. LHD-38 TaxID=3072143 RepID=UPI00280EEE62|nr:carbohydrate ABC transporter permease [Paenibacillus sp. LHD-38]MDQ8739242.1 carbohydrate ABC transporter permease [Paenibacillus sp. LHD-38]